MLYLQIRFRFRYIFPVALFLILVTNQYNWCSPQLIWQIAALTAFRFLPALCRVYTYSIGNTSNYFLHKHDANKRNSTPLQINSETPDLVRTNVFA